MNTATTNPATETRTARSAFKVEITDSEAGELVGTYPSLAAADVALNTVAAALVADNGYCRKTWFCVTHVPSGETYSGRIDLLHPSRFGGARISIAARIESFARRSLEASPVTLSDDDRAGLTLWLELIRRSAGG